LGFWRGNGINCMRVFPDRGILFLANDIYKSKAKQLFTASGEKQGNIAKGLCGALAGCTSTLCTYPMDLIRTRVAGIQSESGRLCVVFNSILKNDGCRGFYRGIGLSLFNVFPYSGICFAIYGLCKDYIGEEHHFISGAFAGMITGTVTFPIDTVRRCLQSSGAKQMNHYSGFKNCFKTLWREEGPRRFFRGAGVNILRISPQQAITFCVFENLKTFFEKQEARVQFL